jgi:hypothetical protein
VRVTAVLATVVVFALSGCTSAADPPAAQHTPSADAPTPTLPAAAASALAGEPGDAKGGVNGGVKGDLAVVLAGDCLIRKGDHGTVWLRLELAANWLGAAFPAVGYRVTADSGATVSGDVKAAGPFVAAINGAGFLGRDVTLTVHLDPANAVPEVNEDNNILRLTVTTPAIAPADDADYVVACR